MTTRIEQETQHAIALACIADAVCSAIDPSGAALLRARGHLRAGLALAEKMGSANSPAAHLVRETIATLEESMSQ